LLRICVIKTGGGLLLPPPHPDSANMMDMVTAAKSFLFIITPVYLNGLNAHLSCIFLKLYHNALQNKGCAEGERIIEQLRRVREPVICPKMNIQSVIIKVSMSFSGLTLPATFWHTNFSKNVTYSAE
jgi:hypothetical protein